MSKKSINLTSKDLITKRDDMCKMKTNYWRIIRSENVMSKNAKKAGVGSGFDLAALHNKILQLSENIIKVKLMLIAINHAKKGDGITFNYEDAKKTHYYTIYAASEKKEQLAHWEEILKKATINPVAKKKAGPKGTGKVETFSVEKITAMKNKLQLDINKLNADISKFNDETTITVTDESMEDMFVV